MDPQAIISSHPNDVREIPLKKIREITVKKRTIIQYDIDIWDVWDTTITGPAKRLTFRTATYPADILDNPELRNLLGDRFHPQPDQ